MFYERHEIIAVGKSFQPAQPVNAQKESPGQEKRRVPRRELPSYGRQKRPSPSRIEVTGNPGMVIARQGAERSFV